MGNLMFFEKCATIKIKDYFLESARFMDATTTQIIQTMLIPVVLISACALFILGMNNKYSSVIGRIRMLEQERRSLKRGEQSASVSRLESVVTQLTHLRKRVRWIRNAVLCYSMAAGLFLLDSLLLGAQALTLNEKLFSLSPLIFFLFGMLSVFFWGIFRLSRSLAGLPYRYDGTVRTPGNDVIFCFFLWRIFRENSLFFF